MKQRCAISVTAVSISILAALTLFGDYPKRYTERITIAGAGRHGEIAGEAAHSRFGMGGGPGFSTNGVPQRTGWIAEDWLTRLPEPSAALTQHVVILHVVIFHVTAFKGTSQERHEHYLVHYSYDPVTNRGYIRLPAKGEAHYAENVRMPFRGAAFEGTWFAATPAWTAAAEAALQASPAGPPRR
jgi:hypothetical protein